MLWLKSRLNADQRERKGVRETRKGPVPGKKKGAVRDKRKGAVPGRKESSVGVRECTPGRVHTRKSQHEEMADWLGGWITDWVAMWLCL